MTGGAAAGEGVQQAVIIAGGKATRLRPYTDDRPKILVEIAGRSILQRQVEWLASGGVEHVVVSSGYLAEVLEGYVAATALPVPVTVVTEHEPLGRGGGLKYAAAALPYPDRRWVGLNGDILTDLDVADLYRSHRERGVLATVAVAPLRSPYGVVEFDEQGLVRQFTEGAVLPYWINAGVYLFEPDVTGLLPDRGDHEVTTFPALAEDGRLYAYRFTGYWRGVDTSKDIHEATQELAGR